MSRRRMLANATAVASTAGLLAGAVPFLSALRQSAAARAVGAPVVVDISKLEPGRQITVRWRGQPVWVLHRSIDMIGRIEMLHNELRDPQSRVASQQPVYAVNTLRSLRPEFLVVVGLCTHLGCVPAVRADLAPPNLGPAWPGGSFCPCHGSRFDFAGRVYRSAPAPTNLLVTAQRYLTDTIIEIGTGPENV